MLNMGVISGYVVEDPAIQYREKDGKPYAKIELATERDFRPGGKKYLYDYNTFTSYGKIAENAAKFLKKGQTITIEYELRSEKVYTIDEQKFDRPLMTVRMIRFDRLKDKYNPEVESKKKDFSPEEAEIYEGFDEEGFLDRTPMDGKNKGK